MAKSISPRQNQFEYGKIIFNTAKYFYCSGKIISNTAESIWKRQIFLNLLTRQNKWVTIRWNDGTTEWCNGRIVEWPNILNHGMIGE